VAPYLYAVVCRDAEQMTGFTMKLLTLFLCLSLTVVAFVSSADVKDDEDVSMVKFKKFKVKVCSIVSISPALCSN
jgi:hypothetical protein